MKFYRIACCLLAAAALLSCSKGNADDPAEATGYVKFTAVGDLSVTDVTRSAVSDYTQLPSGDAFNISVKNSDGTEIYKGLVSGWDADHKLAVGRYSVVASYGAEGTEGFDKPYFTGSKEFDVIGGETTAVSVEASLGNCIVKTAVTDMFRNYFKDYSFTVTTGSGAVIPFPASETRGAFVDAYKLTISGNLVKTDGKSVELSPKDYHDLKAATCYTITFDVSNVGGLKLSITFNDSVETVDLGEIELN